MKKKVMFAYISKDNRKFLEDVASTSGQSMSFCLDKIMDIARSQKNLKIEKTIPKYVRAAKEWSKKNPQLSV